MAIAGSVGGYGNYTCIQHGGSMSTCYGHQSSIGVTVGPSVSQGQVIGAVGNTGNSTGPHLHFEVRIGGSPVNPMGYLLGARRSSTRFRGRVPELDIGPHHLQAFGVALALGFLAAGALARAAAGGAGQAGRLGLRDGVRGAGRRPVGRGWTT